MREAKFRLWNGNKMFYAGFYLEPNGFIVHADNEIYFSDNFKPILLQYTGLKDKKGKEIYEGDILKITQECYTGDFFGDYGAVYYATGIGGFLVKMERSHMHVGFYAGASEIIGNIYENPDLLENQNGNIN